MASNVSYQLFNKQLNPSDAATNYGPDPDFKLKYLTTEVNNVESSRQIESAFQQQLLLTEHYKGITPFNGLKSKVWDNIIGKSTS